MAGPTSKLRDCWKLIREKIVIEDPEPFGLFLGCTHEEGTCRPDAGKRPVRTMTYNVQAYLEKSIAKYLSVLPPGSKLRKVPTPFLSGQDPGDVARPVHAQGDARKCPWCLGVFHEADFLPPEGKHKARGSGGSSAAGPDKPAPRGVLAEKAASVLMQILYAARYARFDLLCAVSKLAQRIATWDEWCDKAINRLMCYISSTLHWRQVGYVGDSFDAIRFHLYADADFAGDPSKKSTSGLHVALRGPRTYFPINGQSKRQDCVSHSTPEAEIVAADFALRREGLPCLDLWDSICPGHPPLVFHEDNESMIQVCRTGRNPTMRWLLRSHAVAVAWLKETFDRGDIDLQYEQSARQAADIYTKGFDNGDKWNEVCVLIGMYDMSRFTVAENIAFWANPPPTKAELRALAEAESSASCAVAHGRLARRGFRGRARLSCCGDFPAGEPYVHGRGVPHPFRSVSLRDVRSHWHARDH